MKTVIKRNLLFKFSVLATLVMGACTLFGISGVNKIQQNEPGQIEETNNMLGLTEESRVFENITIARTRTVPPFLLTLPQSANCHNLVNKYVIPWGYYAASETRLFHQILRHRCKQLNSNGQPPLVVDAGANVGYFTNYAASMGCRVLAFEIQTNMSRAIEISISLNKFDHLVQIYNLGLSDKEEAVLVSIECNDGGATHIGKKKDNADPSLTFIPAIARTVKLDDYVDEDVLLMKIDTEGYEDHVLKGAVNLFKNHKVENIISEFKLSSGDVQWKTNFLNTAESKGYSYFCYSEAYNAPPNIMIPIIEQGPPRLAFKQNSHAYEDFWFTLESDPQKYLSDVDAST